MSNNFNSLQYLTPILLIGILAACAAPTGTPPTPVTISSPTVAVTNTVIPSKTPNPSPTAIHTPPALPEIFVSEHLNPNDTPHTYIGNTCEYLKNRWNPDNAAPGTVVMIIMLHSINRGQALSSDSITAGQFGNIVENLREQGFQAIDTKQLADFLQSNKHIPYRSVVFVQDGRYNAEHFNSHFHELWDFWEWPVVNAWIVQPESGSTLWQENAALEQEGWVDHQLYSPLQRYSQAASVEFLSNELKKFTDEFEDRYQKAPIAIIWPEKPGDHFIEAARQHGIQMGFTSNARGPFMYNWIPLADQVDNSRPAYYPEGLYDDPLMTLPRYWPAQVIDQLDQVRLTGKKGTEYAEQHKEIELEYYDIV